MLFSVAVLATQMPQGDPQQSTPDNTKVNKRDRDKGAVTADQQGMSPSDREITRRIRRAIYKDKSLST